MPRWNQTVEERFWSKVDKNGLLHEDGSRCWLWTGGSDNRGYGRFWLSTKMVLPHRYIYEKTVGAIPDGHDLDHRTICPKSCVNPHHIRACTRKQNMENQNAVNPNSASGARGVHRHRDGWQVRVKHHGVKHSGGNFKSLDEAIRAARELRKRLFTHNDEDR